MLVAATGGWRVACPAHRWPARLVRRWIDRVVRPLLASRFWGRRTAGIALNNTAICAAMTAAGSLGLLAWVAVAGVGLSLGIGLRLLLAEDPFLGENTRPPRAGRRLIAGLGLSLNLLEPPAILLAGGLTLAQKALWPFLPASLAWCAFLWAVVPLLLLAAAGESLWMGILRPGIDPSESTPGGSIGVPQAREPARTPIDRGSPTCHDTR